MSPNVALKSRNMIYENTQFFLIQAKGGYHGITCNGYKIG